MAKLKNDVYSNKERKLYGKAGDTVEIIRRGTAVMIVKKPTDKEGFPTKSDNLEITEDDKQS